MATDEALLEHLQDDPCIRIYTWSRPTLSLGYFQDLDAVLGSLPHPMAPSATVRRITGGGAIWHAAEVTYCLVARLGVAGFPSRTQDCYPLIHGRVAAALAVAGRPDIVPRAPGGATPSYQDEVRCFAAPVANDLVDAHGAKVLGSAARTRGDRVLLHGSFKLASNPWDREAVTGCGLDRPTASRLLTDVLAGLFELQATPDGLRPDEVTTIETILEERYGDDRWVRERVGRRP